MTINKCSKQYQLCDKNSSRASFLSLFRLFRNLFFSCGNSSIDNFSFPISFCFDFFFRWLNVSFNHFFNFVSHNKTKHGAQKEPLCLHSRTKRFIRTKNAYCISSSKFQFWWIFKASAKTGIFLEKKVFAVLWSKQRAFKEACRCLQSSYYFSARKKKVKKCREIRKKILGTSFVGPALESRNDCLKNISVMIEILTNLKIFQKKIENKVRQKKLENLKSSLSEGRRGELNGALQWS